MKKEAEAIAEGVAPLPFARILPGGHPVTSSGLFSGTARYTEFRDLLPINLIIMVSRMTKHTQNLAQEAAIVL